MQAPHHRHQFPLDIDLRTHAGPFERSRTLSDCNETTGEVAGETRASENSFHLLKQGVSTALQWLQAVQTRTGAIEFRRCAFCRGNASSPTRCGVTVHIMRRRSKSNETCALGNLYPYHTSCSWMTCGHSSLQLWVKCMHAA
jgi:hypothetical protein